MKHVIITGATSMLGLALIETCLQNDTRVLAFVRTGSKKLHLLPSSDLLTVAECDLDQYARYEPDNSQTTYDAFYHFAWNATQNSQRGDVHSQHQNIGYTLDALHLAHKMGCKRFIGAGSQAEYGRVSGEISEDMRVSPDSAYGVAKYAAGRLCSALAEDLGIEWVWTRIFSTFGPGDMPSTMIMYCINSLLDCNAPDLTPLEQKWDYLYCKDAALAFYLLGKCASASKIYNIGSGVARPLSDYVHILRDAIDPELPLGIGARSYAKNQVMHLCADITRLKEETNFSPTTSFEDGIRHTVTWIKEQRQVK